MLKYSDIYDEGILIEMSEGRIDIIELLLADYESLSWPQLTKVINNYISYESAFDKIQEIHENGGSIKWRFNSE